jgi:hypothetical protein
VRAGRTVIEGLAERAFVLEHLDEYAGVRLDADTPLEDVLAALDAVGDTSPFLSVRIKGEFPKQGANSVVPIFLVEAATRRFDTEEPSDPLELGVDVARFGDDDSVIQPRRGLWAPEAKVIHGQDVVQVAGATLQVARERARPGERPRVKVDVVGVGAGVADILRQHEEIEVVDVNVAEASTYHEEGKPEFSLLRDQLWFAITDWLKSGGKLQPGQAKLEGDLAAPTYSFDVRGRVKVERKEDIKKRLKRSPDRADALALAIYSPPSVEWLPLFGGARRE